ncbi:MAG: FadR family transcriptional regulator [Lentisphaeria bacterium]|nr:FadR family transcriptional regulator [Lentisphaeria bacterium]
MIDLPELKPSTLADEVETSLLEYIQQSGLTPGDPLPKEELLADSLQVSRHVVREGISRLKALGLIESRKRRGMTLVRPNAFAPVSKLAEAKLFTGEECRQMMGIRVIMELGMAEFIYARKTPALLAELRKYAGNKQCCRDMGEEIDFHSRLFAIGGNAMANQFQQTLTTVFQRFEDRPPHGKFPRTPTHRDICDTLENGTAEAFRQVMRKHFSPYIDW